MSEGRALTKASGQSRARTSRRTRANSAPHTGSPSEAPGDVRRGQAAALDLLLLTVFWLLFFWPIIVAKDHLIPYDLIDQHYMYQAFVHRALVEGDAPWWTPNILGGYPIVADPLTALFYPPNLLMHALTPDTFLPYIRLEFQLALHFHWAAIGTYFLARSLTGSRAGALLAALTFAYGAFFAWHVPHLSPISSLSWLPWILLCLHLALRRRSILWTGLGAATFGAMVLAGHALTIVQVSYLVAGLTIVAAAREWRRFPGEPRRIASTVIIGAAIVGLGVALAAVQLLPSLELSGQTDRASFTWADASASSYRPHWLVTTVVPNFFAHSGAGTYWASGDPAETNSYIGLLPLFLAVLAVKQARDVDRGIIALLLAGSLAWLVIAFGSQTWLYRILFEVLPGIDRVRRPGNAIAFVHLGLALLAAYGMRSLGRSVGPEETRSETSLLAWLKWALVAALVVSVLAAGALSVLASVETRAVMTGILDNLVLSSVIVLLSFLLVRFRVAGLIPARLLLIGLIAIAAFDLGTANAGRVYQHHTFRPDSYIGRDWAGNPGDPTVQELLRLTSESESTLPRVFPAARSGSIWANGPLVWDIDSVYGYSVLWPIHYQELFDNATSNPDSTAFDLLGARYIVTTEPIEAVYPDVDLTSFRLVNDGFYRIYENADARDRVWIAYRAIEVNEQAMLGFMRANPDLARDTIVVSDQVPGDALDTPVASGGSVEIVEYENTRVVIEASLPSAGFIVLADTWYPGWQARLDGERAQIYRANHAQRAVWAAAGEHTLVFEYQSSRFLAGSVVTGVAFIILLVLVGIGMAPFLTTRLRTRQRAKARGA